MIKLTSGHLNVGDDETSYQIAWKNVALNATILLQVRILGTASDPTGRALNFAELEGMHLALSDARAQILALSSTTMASAKIDLVEAPPDILQNQPIAFPV
jgi:hypothetical protein